MQPCQLVHITLSHIAPPRKAEQRTAPHTSASRGHLCHSRLRQPSSSVLMGNIPPKCKQRTVPKRNVPLQSESAFKPNPEVSKTALLSQHGFACGSLNSAVLTGFLAVSLYLEGVFFLFVLLCDANVALAMAVIPTFPKRRILYNLRVNMFSGEALQSNHRNAGVLIKFDLINRWAFHGIRGS